MEDGDLTVQERFNPTRPGFFSRVPGRSEGGGDRPGCQNHIKILPKIFIVQ